MATGAGRDPLERFPAELRLVVFSFLDKDDMTASINASPALLATYMTYQNKLLKDLVYKLVDEENMEDALAVMCFPRFRTE